MEKREIAKKLEKNKNKKVEKNREKKDIAKNLEKISKNSQKEDISLFLFPMFSYFFYLLLKF